MLLNLSKNMMIYGGTNALKSLVPLLILPILTLHLTPSEFGDLALIETLVLFLTPFILININSSISVEFFKLAKEELRRYVSDCLLLTFFCYLILSIFFFFFSSLFSQIFAIDSIYFLLLPSFCMLRVSVIVTLTIFQSAQQPLKFFYFSLLQTVIDVCLTIIFVSVLFYGLPGRLFGVYFGFFIASIIGIFLLKKNDYLCMPNLNFFHRILSFALPLIPHVLSGSLIILSGRLFISKYFTNEEVGLYSIAYQIASVMLLVSVSINQAWSPFLFNLLKKDNFKKSVFLSIYLVVFFIVVALAISFFKDILYLIFVSKEFYGSIKYFPVLVLALFFQSVYFLVANFLFFEKKTKQLAMITSLGAILNLILNYFFINMFGVIGIAYSSAFTWFGFMTCVALYTYSIYNNRVL